MSADLSIILVTDSLGAIRTALARWRSAVEPARTELVVAAVGGAEIPSAALATAGFPDHRVVDGGDGDLQVAEWRALQVATAPLVVFAQAHAWPCPGYGAAVLAAHADRRWSVIGPAMRNANPATLTSRVAMWIAYGRWAGEPARGPASDVAGHSSAYDREALRGLGPALAPLLEAGWPLQVALAARGHRCFVEPAARIEIVNPTGVWPLLVHFFRLGRRVAAKRARDWPTARRAAYALGAPLIPALRLWRIAAGTLRRRTPAPWHGLPLLALALVASGAGEGVGFLFGGGAPSRFVRRV